MAYGNAFKSAELGGAAFGDTYTDEQYPLGTIRVQLADGTVAANHTDGTTSLGLKGDRIWMFVQAGVAVEAYDCVVNNAVSTPLVVKPTVGAGDLDYTISGIAQNAIAISSYGWIVIRGECVVKGAAGITAGLYLDTNGAAVAGQCDDSLVTDTLIATALTATGTPVAATVACRLWLP
tara:strand:+ start:58 stop:591 length:534 start_codon:yes stop_codon:yes gene_type:complete